MDLKCYLSTRDQVYVNGIATIPAGYTSIEGGEYRFSGGAFRSNATLVSLDTGSTVAAVGEYAAKDATALTSVVLGDSVESVGVNAFEGASSLVSLVVGSAVSSIGASAFQGTALTMVALPPSVITVGTGAFPSAAALCGGAGDTYGVCPSLSAECCCAEFEQRWEH